MTKRLIYVVVDLDIYQMTLTDMEMDEQKNIDDQISDQGNVKEVKKFVDFANEVRTQLLVGQDQETVDDVNFGLDEITNLLDKVVVEESFGFADGEQGVGFYAIVDDQVNSFYDGQIEDYLETGF